MNVELIITRHNSEGECISFVVSMRHDVALSDYLYPSVMAMIEEAVPSTGDYGNNIRSDYKLPRDIDLVSDKIEELYHDTTNTN